MSSAVTDASRTDSKTPPCDVLSLEDPATLRLAASWLRECDYQHNCAGQYEGFTGAMCMDFPASRLIDVGTAEEPHVRIIIPLEDFTFRSSEPAYATLSHCWGDASNSRHVSITTTTNLVSRKRNIDISGLPKTFRDAIQITREIGLRYLWIDSLCIIQDDPLDVDRECAVMSSIYNRCYCMIAASDSSNGDGGCFKLHPSSKTRTTSIQCRSIDGSNSATVTVYRGYDDWTTSLDGPLQKRGWALQERHLSPRVLHFTNTRILFECQVC
jgi:hypothetical protein